MQSLSRTAWDEFIKCKRCFFISRKLGIRPISFPGYPINSKVDSLLKNEFDFYRKKNEPHPIFKQNNLNFVPLKLEEQKLKDFRNNRKGVRAKSIKTKFEIFGAVDDLWLNKDTNEVVVVDYKATSNKKELDYVNSEKSYHKSYLRQLDFYAYLLELNKYKIFKIGYWVLCNAGRTDQNFFESKLNFKIDLLTHEIDTSYIEDSLVELEKCFNSDKIPSASFICDTCRWQKETKKI